MGLGQLTVSGAVGRLWRPRVFRNVSLGLGLLAGLSACTSMPPAEHMKTDGLLVFELVSNDTVKSGSAFLNQFSVTPTDGVLARSFGPAFLTSGGTAYYVTWLPAGSYKFDFLSSPSQMLGGYRLPVSHMLANVTIKAGEITDAQALVLQPLDNKRYAIYQVPDEDGTLARHRQDLLNSPAMQSATVETVSLAPGPGTADAALARSRDMTDALYSYGSTVYKGTLYRGAKLGRIWLRDASGTWRSLDTGTLATVTAIHVDANAMIAGFDNGSIRISVDGGATWTSKIIGNGYGSIEAVVPGSGENYLMGVRKGDHLEVHRLENLQTSSIFLKEFDDTDWKKPPMAFSGDAFTLSGSRFIVNVKKDKFAVMDVNARVWSEESGPKDHSMFSASDDGTLLVRDPITYVKNDFISQDGGVTWQKIDASHDMEQLSAGGGGLAVMEKASLISGDYSILLTRDYGKNWINIQGLSGRCSALDLISTTHDIFCEMPEGKIYHSADGKPWTEEHVLQPASAGDGDVFSTGVFAP